MDYVRSALFAAVSTDLKEILMAHHISPEQIEECALKITETAIEIRESQTGNLVTLKDDLTQEFPILIHYKPRMAAQIIVALITGIAGAGNPLAIWLAVIACGLALGDIRERAGAREALLFKIIFESENHQLQRNRAKETFLSSLKELPEIDPVEFEIALHGLIQWGCLKLSGEYIKVSDPLVIYKKQLF